MRNNPYAAQLLQRLGTSPLESETTMWSFSYVADFDAIVAGSSLTTPVRIDAGVYFIVQAVLAVVQYGDTNIVATPAVANQPLSRSVDGVTAASLTNAHIDHTRIRVSTSQRPWMDAPVKTGLITGEPGRLFVLPTPIVVAPNNSIETEMFNDLDTSVFTSANATINAQVVFQGMKISAATVNKALGAGQAAMV